MKTNVTHKSDEEHNIRVTSGRSLTVEGGAEGERQLFLPNDLSFIEWKFGARAVAYIVGGGHWAMATPLI